jgi:hypothetical protein
MEYLTGGKQSFAPYPHWTTSAEQRKQRILERPICQESENLRLCNLPCLMFKLSVFVIFVAFPYCDRLSAFG